MDREGGNKEKISSFIHTNFRNRLNTLFAPKSFEQCRLSKQCEWWKQCKQCKQFKAQCFHLYFFFFFTYYNFKCFIRVTAKVVQERVRQGKN